MQTVLIAHNYTLSNFSAMSYSLANYLAEIGYSVVFVTHSPKFSKTISLQVGKGQLTIYSWPSKKRPTTFQDFIWYIKIHLKHRPNFVLGHFVGGNISIMTSKILSLFKTKTFDYYHTISGAIIEDIKKITFRYKFLFFRKRVFYKLFCDHVICPSLLAQKDLEYFFKINKGIIVVNPMLDRFSSEKTFENTKNILISYLGRLDSAKGVLELIEAFKDYRRENTNSKIILQIAGSGGFEEQIKALVENEKSISFFGKLSYDKIDSYLVNSHYTIIPSKFDNLPTVGLESLMNGIPLLISNKTGLTDYLTEDKNCYKFNPNFEDIKQVFYKVESEFYNQKGMCVYARKIFLEKFNMNEYYDSILKLLK